ncbi:MAG: flavin reductase family protein [Theionarchaea archaeon]|nr:flavin reductase family protein [Theionarchaea archaeon]
MKKIHLALKSPQPSSISRYLWKQCITIRQVVLITSCDAGGKPDIAPKTWVTPCRDDPPMIVFCCTKKHQTARNILSNGEFVVNYPSAALVEKVACTGSTHEPQKVPKSGFTLIPSEKVRPPRLEECYLHLECTVAEIIYHGPEGVIFFGDVIAASGDEIGGSNAARLKTVDPLLYGNGMYGKISGIHPWKWVVAP